MTREEALETLKENLCAICAYGSQNMMSCDIKYCDNREAIKALEQEPLLDKIKIEIADIYCGQYCENSLTPYAVREKALEIIDKYRSESEEI